MSNAYKSYGITSEGSAIPIGFAGVPDVVPEAENAQKLAGVNATEYALKTGTVSNASLLNNKSPEYYLTPVNLLLNSNWRKPSYIINHKGFTSGGVLPEWDYFIDKWKEYAGSTTSTFTFDESGALLNGTIAQAISNENIISGNEYTFAVYFTDETAICASGTVTTGNADWTQYAANGDNLQASIFSDDAKTIAVMFRDQGTKRISGLALYEGSYTADTLPPYISTHPKIETLKISNEEQSANLLRNSNFTSQYLVNHLGYISGSTVSPWSEFVDCWENANDAEKTFTLSDDGINIPANTTIWQISNRVSEGDVITIAACDGRGDIYAASGTVHFNSDESWYRCFIGNGNNFGLSADTYHNEFEFIIWAENDVKIQWAVLCKGAYTAETLPQPQWLHPRLEMMRMGLENQPVNLLDNSDFSNPLNRNGQTSYIGLGSYSIDRWYVGGSNQRIDVLSGSVKCVTTKGSAYATIAQNVKNVTRYAGKTMTFAAYVCSNVIPRLNVYNGDTSFAVASGLSGNYNLIICSFVVPNNITDGMLSVRIQSKSTQENDYVEVKWAALYESLYTTETLPPYVPKGYAVEALNCGVPVYPHNLFDNSDFTNPVNQRGQTSYSPTSAAYGIDRWLVGGGTSISLTSDGIILANPSAYNRGIEQVLEYRDGTYTVAALVNGSVCVRTFTLAGGTVTHGAYNDNGTGIQPYISKGSVTEYYRIALQLKVGYEAVTIKWVALYEGAYTAETIPPYVPKGYGAEFTECQKYFIQIKCKNKPLGSGHAFTADAVRILVPTPASMMTHKTPTITFETSDGVESDAAGTMLIATNGTLLTPTAVNSDGVARENGVILLCTVSGATTYQPASLYCSGIISFSADL